VAHRGFVQSGFNDIPHPAAGLIQPRDLVEPSSIERNRSAVGFRL
jgi:hypothetical protein